jgi:hypothetical protein
MAATQPTQPNNLISALQGLQTITPPPAYTMNIHAPAMPVTRADFEDDGDENEGDDLQNLSAIRLFIDTPLTVVGDNNMIALDASVSASKIALAVVQALKQMTMEGIGVPMIDEDGRPRPIKVNVVAETTVTGSKNVVGERAVLSTLFVGSGARKEKMVVKVDKDTKKRDRAGSEPLEMDAKRSRRD